MGKQVLAKSGKKAVPGKKAKVIKGNPKPVRSRKSKARATKSKKTNKKKQLLKNLLSNRPKLRRLLRWPFVAMVIVVMIPIVLGLIYRSPSVHPVSTLMIANWIANNKVDRRWVPYDRIAPVLVHSVMISEDGRYCQHKGVDWGAVNSVIDDAMEGEKTRGASTITMQSVKNLFLWNSRSYIRKVLEIPLAIYVDLVWPKRRQMEIYLNIAEWGPGIYGIEAAAKHHFGRSAAKLSRRQAALLAVTLPNPKLRNPKKPSRRMKVLARINRARARKAGAYVRCLRKPAGP